MKLYRYSLLLVIFLVNSCVAPECDNHYYLEGKLEGEVEIIMDDQGIPHIYAENQHDLFFAQGFIAAKERLFQFEIWRRQATGTVAEILGERELKRDIGTRLFKFRGDIKEEMRYYHEDGEEIISAFVEGVNAYVDEVKNNPEKLPIEFQLLNIEPDYWTPEVVVSRHQGLLMNINQELNTARAVSIAGEDKVKFLSNFKPEPDLSIDPKINTDLLQKDILELYNAFRKPVSFESTDLSDTYLSQLVEQVDPESIGSNNWVISGELSETGYPVLANDPHRRLSVPSLRYVVHLNAPGWDVIGGGEPEIPGVSIGHNGFGAWGLTVFQTDSEDLYVYQTNPENRNQYLYNGSWEEMEVIYDTVNIKDSDAYVAELKYTRHGPVVFEDKENNVAYGVRCGWLEVGGSPYLSSLRIDQAKSWEEFREACNYFHIPGENMIWADREGNIGWQSVGIAPIRNNWSGMVPVPGDGSYEWEGYLEIKKKPHISNPDSGFFSTANDYLIPEDYPHRNATGYMWSDSYRNDRIKQWIKYYADTTLKMPFADHKYLQTSYSSMNSVEIVVMLRDIDFEPKYDTIADKIQDSFAELSPDNGLAGLYVLFENELKKNIYQLVVPKNIQDHISYLSMEKMIFWLQNPNLIFGSNGSARRDEFIQNAFETAVEEMINRYGNDLSGWKYGGEDFKHVTIKHSLDPILDDSLKEIFNLPVLPRGGNSLTVNNTGNNNNQTHGATFRIIIDTENFDKSVWMNSPGQSGNPGDSHYDDLYERWADNQLNSLHYSKDSVIAYQDYILKLFNKNIYKE